MVTAHHRSNSKSYDHRMISCRNDRNFSGIALGVGALGQLPLQVGPLRVLSAQVACSQMASHILAAKAEGHRWIWRRPGNLADRRKALHHNGLIDSRLGIRLAHPNPGSDLYVLHNSTRHLTMNVGFD